MVTSPTSTGVAPSNLKVAVVGACGTLGQPLCLLLKSNPKINELALFDLASATTPVPGVAADLSHINTAVKVTSFVGDEQMGEALKGATIVICVAGVRKPGSTKDEQFNANAKVVKAVASAVAKFAPKAFLFIVTNPLNSMVPLAAQVLKAANCFDSKRLIGVSALDVCRAKTFWAEKTGCDINKARVPVVGGYNQVTAVPLFSQAEPKASKPLSPQDYEALDKKVQDAGPALVQLKGGASSSTLSKAHAVSRLVDKVLNGLSGKEDFQCCYVSNGGKDDDFWVAPCAFGKSGVERTLPLGNITEFEKKRIEQAKGALKEDIARGVAFAKSS